MNPKVSVCMPNYNSARFLPEAIESVLKQCYGDFEFIIIDDCSTDTSLEVINFYAKKDPRIVVWVNQANVGQVKNLNLCLDRARGEYIKFLFSDDVLNSSEIVGRMAGILDADDNVALVSSARYLIDERSSIRSILSEYESDFEQDGKAVITDCLFSQKNKVGEPTTAMFRKAHADRGFSEQYQVNLDWEMWLHILEKGSFVYINEPLCSFRLHANQQTAMNAKKPTRWFAEPFKLLQDYGSKPYVHLSKLQRIYMGYLPAFEIWRFYGKFHRISMRATLKIIQSNYGLLRFFCMYPMYKLYKGTLSAKKRIRKFSKRFRISE